MRKLAVVTVVTAAFLALTGTVARACDRDSDKTTHGVVTDLGDYTFPCVAESSNPYRTTTTSATMRVRHDWTRPDAVIVTFHDDGTWTGDTRLAGSYADDYRALAVGHVTFQPDGQVKTADRFTYLPVWVRNDYTANGHRFVDHRYVDGRWLVLHHTDGSLFFSDKITLSATPYTPTSPTTDDVTCG